MDSEGVRGEEKGRGDACRSPETCLVSRWRPLAGTLLLVDLPIAAEALVVQLGPFP